MTSRTGVSPVPARPPARRRAAAAAALALGLTTALVATPAAGVPATHATEVGVDVPAPDLLDVDLDTGSFTDAAAARPDTVFGEDPPIAFDRALGRDVVNLDGTQAVRYDFADGYNSSQLTVECTFRVDAGGAAPADTDNFCGSKQGGGFSLNAGENAKILVNVGGTYYSASSPVIEGVWYHAVGVWDGSTLALYLNGVKVDERAAEGDAMKIPPESSRYFFIGADVAGAGQPEYFGAGQVAQAAVYSTALTAVQVAARYDTIFADRTQDVVTFEVTSPATTAVLIAPTVLDGSIGNSDLLAGSLTLTLDGVPVALGDEIGPGLSRGEHTIAYTGSDRLGAAVEGSVTFTSVAIPTAAGTSETSENGTATLTATATHPTDGPLRTTFLKGDTDTASNVERGTIPLSAFDRVQGVDADVELADATPVDDPLLPDDGLQLDSGRSTDIPALRADVEFTTAGQSILWSGEVDPAREVHLLLLDTTTGRYQVAASARGATDGPVELSAAVTDAHDDNGVVHALVLGTDPFADDLDKPVDNAFEDPEDVDFSMMHITDNQYLSSASVGKKNPEEREVWAAGYEDSYRWLAQNADAYKVAFVAHTGDVIDHWRSSSTDVERAEAEYAFASSAHEILEATEIPNAILPGNHDNRDGQETGSDSMFNSYFGAARFQAQAQTDGWAAEDASYHPMQPGNNENSYTLFTAAGQDFVVVSLGYRVTTEEADWASDVFTQYSSRNGIILTHAAHVSSQNPDGREGARSADGVLLSERVMEQNPNVMLLLAGHVTGATINVRHDVGQPGNNVVELTSDYQSYKITAEQLGIVESGEYEPGHLVSFGATFFRLLQFDVDRSELSVDTYSAHLDEFGATEYDVAQRYNGQEDDFRIPIQLQSRTTGFSTDALLGATPTVQVVGVVTHDSDQAATVTWNALRDGVPYTWFAVTRDATEDDDVEDLQALALAAGAGRADLPGGRMDEGIVQLGFFLGTGKSHGTGAS